MTASRKIPTVWIKHLNGDPKKQKDFEDLLRNSTRTLSRLAEILDEFIEQNDAASISLKELDHNNWAIRQADYIATKRAFKKIRDLVTFIERN